MKSSALFFKLPHDLRRAVYLATHSAERKKWRHRRRNAKKYTYRPFDERRAIFVHVPKAAGMSIARSLFGGYAGGHTTLAEYQLIFSRRDFESYFKFAFVRNPWDRAYSAYRFLARGGMNDQDRAFWERYLKPYADFGDFVRRGLRAPGVLDYFHFTPQSHFLCAPGQTRPGVDFVGYFENLADDFATVGTRLLGTAPPLPHENSSGERDDYREAYSDETRRIVGEVYARDIDMLGYTFDNSSLPAQLAARP